MSGGKTILPLVIRTQGGAGTGEAGQHSQSLESIFVHVPGFKVVMPTDPYEVKGLLNTAIEDDNPVMFIEHKLLYSMKGDVPEEYYAIPFGEAAVRREGSDVTVIGVSKMIHDAMAAAEELEQEGISAEVIDPRTLVPLDRESIFTSVSKTGRMVVVHEASKTLGIGAELVAQVVEEGVCSRVRRVAGEDVPMPYSKLLESRVLPNKEKIKRAVHELVEGEA
jgi:pyruvate dehydrogenase E1 component beta subunit